jgi:hypothetical protein
MKTLKGRMLNYDGLCRRNLGTELFISYIGESLCRLLVGGGGGMVAESFQR